MVAISSIATGDDEAARKDITTFALVSSVLAGASAIGLAIVLGRFFPKEDE